MNKLLLISLLTLSISKLNCLDIPSKDDFRDREIPWTPMDSDDIAQQIDESFIDNVYRKLESVDVYHDRKALELDLIKTSR